MSRTTVFVGIFCNANGGPADVVVSRTKIGLSEAIGVNVRTVERWFKEGEPSTRFVKGGKRWLLFSGEPLMGNRSVGNVGNLVSFGAGFRGMKGKDGLLESPGRAEN